MVSAISRQKLAARQTGIGELSLVEDIGAMGYKRRGFGPLDFFDICFY
jgi:hypothetical protein